MKHERLASVGVLLAVLGLPVERLGVRGASERPPLEAQALLINIAKTADLSFGELVTGVTAGTVVVSPAGVRSATGGTTLGNASGAQAASFNVTALAFTGYHIVLPGSVTITGSGSPMTVNTFTSNPSGTGNVGLGGAQTLTVGARLNVGASQASGNYTGTFDVTVTVP